MEGHEDGQALLIESGKKFQGLHLMLDIEVTRVPGVEGRGCAAVMQELMKQGD